MIKLKERAERIVNDDHFSLAVYDYARDSLYSYPDYMSERDYQKPEEIPESDNLDEMEFFNLLAWKDSVKPELEEFLEDSFGCIAFGTIGRWNGRHPYGHIINSMDNLLFLWNNCDSVRITIKSFRRLWRNFTIPQNFANKVYGLPKRQYSGR